jgi:4-hydroxy-tetrahydrodipicolinate synthase
MPEMTVHCRSITTFAADGSLDEDAFRQFLQRFVDSRLGVYMAAGGPCEGFTLSRAEIARVYQIGVEICHGKVFIGGNGVEQHTAKDSLEIARLGVEAGVDVVNIYGPAGWHGFVPSDEEYLNYFDNILPEIRHPVALAPNPLLGYTPKATVIAQVANRYPQVVSVNLAGMTDDTYLIELQGSLRHDVEIYVPFPAVFAGFALGASGLNAYHANIIPKTYRLFLDLYADGKLGDAGKVYAKIRQFEKLCRNPAWSNRWVKVAMKVFKLPGGEGGLREPYLMPKQAVLDDFAASVIALDIPEINELATAADPNVTELPYVK